MQRIENYSKDKYYSKLSLYISPRLQHFLLYTEEINKDHIPSEKQILWLFSRDIVHCFPSCSAGMCLKAIG